MVDENGNEVLGGTGLHTGMVFFKAASELHGIGIPKAQADTFVAALFCANERLDHAPGIGVVAEHLCKPVDTVKRDLRALVDRGLLRRRDSNLKAHRSRAKGWFFPTWDTILSLTSKRQGGSRRSPQGDQGAPLKGDQGAPPEVEVRSRSELSPKGAAPAEASPVGPASPTPPRANSAPASRWRDDSPAKPAKRHHEKPRDRLIGQARQEHTAKCPDRRFRGGQWGKAIDGLVAGGFAEIDIGNAIPRFFSRDQDWQAHFFRADFEDRRKYLQEPRPSEATRALDVIAEAMNEYGEVAA